MAAPPLVPAGQGQGSQRSAVLHARTPYLLAFAMPRAKLLRCGRLAVRHFKAATWKGANRKVTAKAVAFRKLQATHGATAAKSSGAAFSHDGKGGAQTRAYSAASLRPSFPTFAASPYVVPLASALSHAVDELPMGDGRRATEAPSFAVRPLWGAEAATRGGCEGPSAVAQGQRGCKALASATTPAGPAYKPSIAGPREESATDPLWRFASLEQAPVPARGVAGSKAPYAAALGPAVASAQESLTWYAKLGEQRLRGGGVRKPQAVAARASPPARSRSATSHAAFAAIAAMAK